MRQRLAKREINFIAGGKFPTTNFYVTRERIDATKRELPHTLTRFVDSVDYCELSEGILTWVALS